MDRRGPALLALGVALLLLVNPVYLLPHAGQPEYSHSIERVPASEVPADAEVLHYAELSAAATAAIRDARTGDGIVYGKANKPPEFFYSDYARLNEGIYYVQQNGTYYRLTTYAGGGLFPINLLLRWALVLLGGCIGLLGYASLREYRRRLPIGFSLYGILVLLGAVFQPGRGMVIGIDTAPILLLAIIGIVASLVTFGAIADRSLALGTAVTCVLLFVLGSGLWLFERTTIGGAPELPVHPAVAFVFALVSILIAGGYVGRVAYRRASA